MPPTVEGCHKLPCSDDFGQTKCVRAATSYRRSIVVRRLELQQSQRVRPTDLLSIGIAQWSSIEPPRGFEYILERIVGREHDAIRPQFGNRVKQGRRIQMTGSRDVEVG